MLLGNILKENRERLGLNIEQVSQQLSIPERYLNALEENNFDVIPGEYYVKDFVTKYAGLLGLNGEQLLLQIDQQRAQAEQQLENVESVEDVATTVAAVESHKPTKPVLPTSVEEVETVSKGRLNVPRIILALLAVLLLLALAFNFVFGLFNPNKQSNTATSTESTQVVTTETTAASDESASSTTETTKTETTEQSSSTSSAASTAQSVASSSTAATQQPAAVTTQAVVREGVYTIASSPGLVEYGLGSGYAGYTGQHRLTLRVTEPTWVSISIHGKKVYERITAANATIPITANANASDVTIKLGISSGASLVLNDQPVAIPTTSRVQTVKINLAK